MELQRRRRSLGLALVVIAFGVVALLCAWGARGSLGAVIFLAGGVLALGLGAALARDELRPFRFAIGPDGVTLRDGTLVAWAAIERVVLDEPTPPATSGPHLVLEPGERVVLKLDEVRQSQQQIAEALQRYGGGRLDNRIARRGDGPGFAVVLRGYERGRVDRLLRQAADALLGDDPSARAAARAALQQPDLLVVARGYDPAQVDAHLRKLATRL
ncbi:hypothetical protein AB0M46_11210 [Dactylosporangium sp. NPDC051485]|uniref:hypothetical protein n=1 Tax=Dactylosporangium sp. NPDC051485 TaxID=3154846 RepID=UPI003420D46F